MLFFSETKGVHDQCNKTIASLRIENEQLYTELGRLQTENVQLKEEISKLPLVIKLFIVTAEHFFIPAYLLRHFLCG